jgi:hypothetical protein
MRRNPPQRPVFFAHADRYLDSRDKDVANLALALLQHFEKFFAFLRHERVEPVARLLTVTRTCRMQLRAPLVYLVTAIRSYRNTLPMPSVLKTASTT